jgi:cysteine-S-conjugate beta-lyase
VAYQGWTAAMHSQALGMRDPWFDDAPERRGTWSEKWDQARPDELPLWVADMDFRAPEPILEALRERLDHGVLGYPHVPQELLEAVAAHQAQAHGWAVDPAWIVPLPGLVCGLHVAARTIGEDGDSIATSTPIYPPFLSAPLDSRRHSVQVALDEHVGWTLDRADLLAGGDQRTRGFWLCQPQNPTGRVYRDEELHTLAEVAEQRDWIVVSDEIWGDLVLDSTQRHRPFAAACPQAAQRTITLTAPSKTWNIPGLGCSFAIISDPTLRRRFVKAKGRLVPDVGIMGLLGAHAAYCHGQEWLSRCRTYLRANRDHLAERVAKIPGLRWTPGAATYLAWIDARGSGVEQPSRACRDAGLFVSDGSYFAAPGWIRINFACCRTVLDAACDRLTAAFPAVL